MCDTFVVLPQFTADGSVIFGKNSDRPLFDCQPLMFYPQRKWPAGKREPANRGRREHLVQMTSMSCG